MAMPSQEIRPLLPTKQVWAEFGLSGAKDRFLAAFSCGNMSVCFIIDSSRQ